MDNANSSPKIKKELGTFLIERTEEGAVFIVREDDGIVISPLFSSELGARKWMHHQFVNDLLRHRQYQFGYYCLMFLEGEWFWYDDLEDDICSEPFNEYTTAVKWIWSQKDNVKKKGRNL